MVNCEHMRASLTNILQRNEDRWTDLEMIKQIQHGPQIGSFSSNSRSTRTVTNSENTLSNAILASGFWRNTKRRIPYQSVTSYTVSLGRHCRISVFRQPGGPLALFFIFPRARRTLSIVVRVRVPWSAIKLSPRFSDVSGLSSWHFSQWALTSSVHSSLPSLTRT